MRRFYIYLPVAALCFAAGLLTQQLWRISHPSPAVGTPLAVSMCEIDRDPQQYVGKVIVLRDVLYTLPGDSFVHACFTNGTNIRMSPLIKVVDDNDRPILPEWARQTVGCDNCLRAQNEGWGAEVIVVGTFEADDTPGSLLKGRNFRIIPHNVRQISPTFSRR
jgi:hypothetical protein